MSEPSSVLAVLRDLIKESRDGGPRNLASWQERSLAALRAALGDGHISTLRFDVIDYEPPEPTGYMTESERVAAKAAARREGIEAGTAILDGAVITLSLGPTSASTPTNRAARRVFVVHGRDHGLKEAVGRLVERLGYEPVILHEQPDRGRTILEKFEQESANVAYAIVLLTPDDEGRICATSDPVDLKLRPRQNVVFEFGFFAGVLGRRRVAALVTDLAVERPSDLDGLLYIPVSGSDSSDWKYKLAREMRDAGLEIDLNHVA